MVSFIIINPSHTSFVDFQTCFTFVCLARVHFQHSAELLSRLVKVEANYTLQLYPDEGHSLREERSNQHLHRTLLHYLQNCLKYDPFLNIEEEEEDDEEEEWSLPLCPLSVFRGAQYWCLTSGCVISPKEKMSTMEIKRTKFTSYLPQTQLWDVFLFVCLFVFVQTATVNVSWASRKMKHNCSGSYSFQGNHAQCNV